MSKILVVEDTQRLRTELKVLLERYGYEVIAPETFDNIIDVIKMQQPELLMLDINLPVYDGYYICREVRRFSEVPIIIVTSRDSDMDELLSIKLGADDFITKPYNTEILLARVNAVLKRSEAGNKSKEGMECSGLTINLCNSSMAANGVKIDITKNELILLTSLIKRKNEIVSREELMEELWSAEYFADDNSLSINMTRLRKKLDEIGLKEFIKTKRGQGYIVE
ncbi:response regulator transcription factor [Clostridium sp. CF011]|uniref:response regulator transcription factor n=1 Tax=unclassified Clostridium TaxID=2614128 RepID=UPI001C0DEA19|nr:MULTISPECIES: response regulator transcription factor [unclassified Clostridium]MBU3092132.1 response regulator transcription factor [Clostridium sp. CF011]MBW9147037.1 response regulator transcription factor [Clostridium sp. CM027]UVE41999.1 response regulator transcription factor [Clostridium sp. CM027]WAG71026.1 response regulator transcription factor [Clostridium sp. CF011]